MLHNAWIFLNPPVSEISYRGSLVKALNHKVISFLVVLVYFTFVFRGHYVLVVKAAIMQE